MLQSYFIRSRIISVVLIPQSILFNQVNTLTYKARIQRLYNDGSDLKQQTVEINSTEHIRRCSLHKNDDIWTLYKTVHPNVRTLGDALHEGYINSKDGPCLGSIQTSNGIDSLQWLSYSEVAEKSRYIGSYLWAKTKLIPIQSKVAILSSNRSEYLFAEQACYQYGFVVVSLYTTYDFATILSVLQRTQAEVLIVDNLRRIQTFQDDLFKNSQIKEILVMDDTSHDENSKIRSFSAIFKTMKNTDLRERPTVDPDSIATFILTSGTTGEPKIAMISHENLLATAKGHILRLEKANIKAPLTDRHCSFLPMAHVYERFMLLQVLLGGTQLVFCPEPEKLPYYLSIVKPTQASVVPRVLNKVYDAIMTEVNKSTIKKFLIQQALRERPWFLSYFVFRKVKKLFGNDLKVMITGAAPITPDVMHFFRIALDMPIMEGYGQTESAGAGTSTHPTDVSYGTIGSPVPVIDIKLVDVPDTNYRSENNQGEICVRGPSVFKGYYGDEAKTREVLDKDGWLHTGDVGEWTSDGALRVIDRAKHIFKLSQGHYIAPERLEDVYIRSRWISQIFIDGMPSEATLVAIVIPDEDYVRKNYQSAVAGKTFADLCKDEKLKEIILSDIKRLAKVYKVKFYETLSNIYLHSELFSQNNELLTVTLKTRRANARTRFEPIIKSLYRTKSTTKNKFS
ncbi:unnamed protein product [Rotaria magnacalcarata]|uniref:long-chain-fatty-acid--CoA ligase n=1 Tax=Rotaria magnacalcarata TaxID=392030 RepID=A0A820DEM4_9BILA|nr:unnamed protein product [Rotaria magnacalcarata]CAF4230754.1 unnamed protein product [Rotaria magnacalcarata]